MASTIRLAKIRGMTLRSTWTAQIMIRTIAMALILIGGREASLDTS